jgi:hypothetical protein
VENISRPLSKNMVIRKDLVSEEILVVHLIVDSSADLITQHRYWINQRALVTDDSLQDRVEIALCCCVPNEYTHSLNPLDHRMMGHMEAIQPPTRTNPSMGMYGV